MRENNKFLTIKKAADFLSISDKNASPFAYSLSIAGIAGIAEIAICIITHSFI
jgi:hypothetical protein